MRFKRLLVFIILWIHISVSGSAQCEPYAYTVYDTVCAGESVYGYSSGGIYEDTLPGGDCDTIRTLYLTVAPDYDQIPAHSFFNTGTDGAGGTLPGGSEDLNWQVATHIEGPYAPAVVIADPPASYSASSWPDCTWISHSTEASHGGNMDYYYKIAFDLPCSDSCGRSLETDSVFCLSLDFLADNSVYEVYVNGEPQSAHIPSVPVSSPYYYVGFDMSNMITAHLCYDWKPMNNIIIIHIKSGSPYAGFLAQFFSTAAPVISDPEAGFYTSSLTGTDTPYNSGCIPFEVQLMNTSEAADHFIWDFGDGTDLSSEVHPVHTYIQPGVFDVKLIAQGSHCSTDDTMIQKIYVYPGYQDTVDATICDGDSYLWLDSVMAHNGTYSKVLQSIYGCDSVQVLNLTVHPRPDMAIIQDTVLSGMQSLQLWASGGTDYYWKPSIWLDQDSIPDPVATPRTPITYTVVITNEYGCRDSSSVSIGISDQLMFPDAFSPNGDGLNDEFKIVNYGYQEILDFSIYNRWGECVFITFDGSKGWDGTFNGKPVDPGVYFYRVQVRLWDNRVQMVKGDVTLIR